MHKLFTILIIVSCLFSCSEKQQSESQKETTETTPPPPKVQRHIIDLEEEDFTIEQLIKIDKEIPIIELILPSNISQTDLTALGELELLEKVIFKNFDLTKMNIDFISKRRSINELHFTDCSLNDTNFDFLKRTAIQKITFENTEVPATSVKHLLNASRLEEILTNQDSSTFNEISEKVKINKI